MHVNCIKLNFQHSRNERIFFSLFLQLWQQHWFIFQMLITQNSGEKNVVDFIAIVKQKEEKKENFSFSA